MGFQPPGTGKVAGKADGFKLGHQTGRCRDVNPQDVYPVRYAQSLPILKYMLLEGCDEQEPCATLYQWQGTEDPKIRTIEPIAPFYLLYSLPHSQRLQLEGIS